MSVESDLKQMEENGYVPPAQKPAAQKPKQSSVKSTPLPSPAKTNLLTTAKGHLPALPIALGLIFLGLGTAMVLYRVAR